MILQAVIDSLKIKDEYKAFVEEYKSLIINEFGNKIQSIYMCGSIPKGTAIPYKSDADFTILCENPRDIDQNRLSSNKKILLDKYPFVSKIDTTICSIDDVIQSPNDWGFWIKIISICIYGYDFGEEIPPIEISDKFILDLNLGTEKEIQRVRDVLNNTSDNTLINRYIKGHSKRLIRALFSLVLNKVGIWQDDIYEMKKSIINYSDINPSLVEYLYECCKNDDISIKDFKEKADEAYTYYKNMLSSISEAKSYFG